MSEKVYMTKDLANTVGIAEPTVRKYAQLIEAAGYIFEKEGTKENSSRLFSEADVNLFTQIKAIREETNISLDKAIEMALASNPKPVSNSSLKKIPKTIKVYGKSDKRYEELEAKIDVLVGVNKALMERLDERDLKRDEMLMQVLRESQEMKLLLAATNEEKSDKKWYKFWK
jgi:DNA-binding transcriptional MerR regulator